MRRRDPGGRRCLQVLAMVLLMLGAMAPLTSRVAAGSLPSGQDQQTVDVAAMTLVPADIGQSGYGVEGGRTLDPSTEAQISAEYKQDDADQILASLLDAGFERRYFASLGRMEDGSGDAIVRRITSYVALYDNADGASTGFDLLEDESAVPTAEDVEGTAIFGEQSEITRDESEADSTDQGGEIASLDLTFRRDNLVAGVTMSDMTGDEPTVGEIERLATTLDGKIDDVLASASPGLSVAALRVEGTPSYEAYERQDGVTIPLFDESNVAQVARNRGYGEAEQVFNLQIPPTVDQNASTINSLYVTELLRFTSQRDAALALDNAIDRQASFDQYSDVEAVPDAPTVGDASATMSYTFGAGTDAAAKGFVVYAHVGSDLARVQLDGAGAPPLETLIELATSQIACLEAGVCPDVAEIPAWDAEAPLATPKADSSATPPSNEATPVGLDETPIADEETPEPASVDGDTASTGVDGSSYRGPAYGVSISWNPDDWEVEDELIEEGYEGLQLGTARSTVYIETYVGFDGDTAACVADAVSEIDERDGVTSFDEASDRELPVPESDTDSAQLVEYDQEFDNGEVIPIVEYIDCQEVVPGVVVTEITAQVGADFYDRELAAIQTLLASLDTSGSGERVGGDDETPETGDDSRADATEYTSPTFGFSLTWAASDGWRISGETSADGNDYMALENGVSTVVFEAMTDPTSHGSAALCLLSFGGDDSGAAPLIGENGEPIIGIEGDTLAYAAYRFSSEDIVRYVECRTLVPNEAVLRIVHSAPADAYNEEAPKVESLLAQLILDN